MNPRICLPWIVLACLLVPTVGGTARMPELPLKTDISLSPEPLTQEKFWTLEPRELNPHRRPWFVERNVSLEGLRAVADRSKPVLARLHSACFTGDLLGSLKCD